MRPKSAMYYVAEMNDIVEELCDKVPIQPDKCVKKNFCVVQEPRNAEI